MNDEKLTSSDIGQQSRSSFEIPNLQMKKAESLNEEVKSASL